MIHGICRVGTQEVVNFMTPSSQGNYSLLWDMDQKNLIIVMISMEGSTKNCEFHDHGTWILLQGCAWDGEGGGGYRKNQVILSIIVKCNNEKSLYYFKLLKGFFSLKNHVLMVVVIICVSALYRLILFF